MKTEEKWTLYSEKSPDLNKLLVLFRHQKEKYIIARLFLLSDPETGDHLSWATEYNNCHVIDPNDAWMYFEPFETRKVYE